MKRGASEESVQRDSILKYVKRTLTAEAQQQQQQQQQQEEEEQDPSWVTTVRGDILEADEVYILQQCNCYTVRSHGLSKTLARAYSPWGDPYGTRKAIGSRNLAIAQDRDIPGTVRILSAPDNKKHIVCAFGQLCPGKPLRYKSYPDYETDTTRARLSWFETCLEDLISKVPDLKHIAVPFRIGCGLAGGHWPDYLLRLETFAKRHSVRVCIYRLPDK